MSVSSTVSDGLSFRSELPDDWDVIVIGAGPSGSSAAWRLARAGLRVLIAEAKAFPRDKVCGGCLNQRSWSLLAESGADRILEDAGAVAVAKLRIAAPRAHVEWPMPTLRSVSRSLMDAVLVSKAVEAGAWFSPMTTATVDPLTAERERRVVRLVRRDARVMTATAKVVVCADGLGHPSLKRFPEFAPRVDPKARVGLGAILDWRDEETSAAFPAGVLTMAAGRQGYVGVTSVEGGRLNIAAAMDRRLTRASTSQGDAIAAVLAECRLHIPQGIAAASWTGTLPLTRASRTIAGERLFLVGDAAGYVEPFTGEGMAWAMKSAVLAAPIIMDAVSASAWDSRLAERWRREWKRKVSDRQWPCRLLAKLLRSPRTVRYALSLCRMAPALPNRVMNSICAAPTPSGL